VWMAFVISTHCSETGQVRLLAAHRAGVRPRRKRAHASSEPAQKLAKKLAKKAHSQHTGRTREYGRSEAPTARNARACASAAGAAGPIRCSVSVRRDLAKVSKSRRRRLPKSELGPGTSARARPVATVFATTVRSTGGGTLCAPGTLPPPSGGPCREDLLWRGCIRCMHGSRLHGAGAKVGLRPEVRSECGQLHASQWVTVGLRSASR